LEVAQQRRTGFMRLTGGRLQIVGEEIEMNGPVVVSGCGLIPNQEEDWVVAPSSSAQSASKRRRRLRSKAWQ
jgi:hypothetical protein